MKDQKVFFVATDVEDGTINLSPKGLDSLRVLENNRILCFQSRRNVSWFTRRRNRRDKI